jgi:pimeloyl-ACP methyl ester carboxylesterase
MASNTDQRQSSTHSVDDWSSEPERRYAARQARLAAYCDVSVDSRTLNTDSAGRVHYLVAGDPNGEPVVLLHGVTVTAATWLPIVPGLADEYRLYIPDRPGRGLSAAPSYRGRDLRPFLVDYLCELCDELDLERPHVVGNSLGGLQALLLAIDRDRVDRLCLVGAPAGVSTEFSLAWRLLTMRGVNRLLLWLDRRGDPIENAREAAKKRLVVDGSVIPIEFYELMAARQQLPGREQSLRSLLTEQGSFGRMHPVFDIREEIVDIERPTGFIWGSEDAFWPPELGRSLADQMADAQCYELFNHGHMPWMEPGDETEIRVRAFLSG